MKSTFFAVSKMYRILLVAAVWVIALVLNAGGTALPGGDSKGGRHADGFSFVTPVSAEDTSTADTGGITEGGCSNSSSCS